MTRIAMDVALGLLGLLLLAYGVEVYRGRGRYTVTSWVWPTQHFAPAWFGVTLVALPSADALLRTWPQGQAPLVVRSVAGLALIVGAVAFLVGLVAMVRLPGRLAPRWYRQWCAGGRDPAAFAAWSELTWFDRVNGRTLRRAREREARRRADG
jgi:hypothetical protein